MSVILKLIMARVHIEFLISYFIDSEELWSKHLEWVATNRYSIGQEFADTLRDAGKSVLSVDSKWNKEFNESLEATKVQDAALAAAAECGRTVRRMANFAIDRLQKENTAESNYLASRIRSALGVGQRTNFKRYGGAFRLLTLQFDGITDMREDLHQWPAFESFIPDLESCLENLKVTMKAQTAEQLEADKAKAELEAVVDEAIDIYNSAIKMVNVNSDHASADLVSGLLRLQGTHHKVFYSSKSSDKDD